MKIFNILVLLLITTFLSAQQGLSSIKNSTHTLHVGDKMPDLTFDVSNYKNATAKISDFRGKLLILNLFGVRCAANIMALPTLNKIQQDFSQRLQILSASKNSSEEVEKLKSTYEVFRNSQLPVVTGEAGLASLFEYRFQPTLVWIDEKGIIKYISQVESVTEENIHKFFNGEPLNIKERKHIDFISDDPTLVETYPYFGSDFGVYSYIAEIKDSSLLIGGISSYQREKKGDRWLIRRIRLIKGSLPELYIRAYSNSDRMKHDRIIIEVKDSLKLNFIKDIFNRDHFFDLMVQKDLPDDKIFKYMQQQLDTYYNVTSSLEMRSIPVYVLSRTDANLNLSTKGIPHGKTFEWADSIGHIRNTTWRGFFTILNGAGIYPPKTVIDETGINKYQKLDITMRIDFSNLAKVNESLRPYGLKISEEQRELQAIVLKD